MTELSEGEEHKEKYQIGEEGGKIGLMKDSVRKRGGNLILFNVHVTGMRMVNAGLLSQRPKMG